jgi:hypothetical protein
MERHPPTSIYVYIPFQKIRFEHFISSRLYEYLKQTRSHPKYASIVLSAIVVYEREKWRENKRKKEKRKNWEFWEELIAYFSWYDTDHIENYASKKSSTVVCIPYRSNVST